MFVILNKKIYSGIDSELKLYSKSKNIFSKIESFLSDNSSKTILSFLSYDLKNNIENLNSKNKDHTDFPLVHLIVPKNIDDSEKKINLNYKNKNKILFNPEFSEKEYLEKISKIKNHIQKGDIYETNFCYSWNAKAINFNALEVYKKLDSITEAPFSVYADLEHHQIISASPERFLLKKGSTLISQPIKGTAKKLINKSKDRQAVINFQNSQKERSENIMIVDLVRNDLSKIAKKSSVKVDSLCKLNSFKNIHQLISTIKCELKENVSFTDIIKATFPMGSMTGVPKIKAMQLMDKYENTKRALYSGSIGVILPNGDFDLNVVIRTLIYNKNNSYLSFFTGGAITMESCPEKEYEETLIKAQAILDACK